MSEKSSLILTRKVGEEIVIGEDITITVIDQRQGRTRFKVEAPRETRVRRGETKYEFSLSIRCGNSFMSADLTADELDLLSGHIVAALMNGTETKVTVDGADFSLAEDDLDIVQPPEESAAYQETRAAIDTAEMATK